jgi:hypothetical protein
MMFEDWLATARPGITVRLSHDARFAVVYSESFLVQKYGGAHGEAPDATWQLQD